MRAFKALASWIFVLGLFTAVFVGSAYMIYHEEQLPWWLKIASYCMLGGIFLVMLALVTERKTIRPSKEEPGAAGQEGRVLVQNTDKVPGREISKVLGLVQGHTIFAIWLGKDLSAIIRLVLGGELTEYTEMMGDARKVAIDRMVKQAEEAGADAIINTRFMTTSVVGSAAELLAYGTAVKLQKA